jgi:hypothetical protein
VQRLRNKLWCDPGGGAGRNGENRRSGVLRDIDGRGAGHIDAGRRIKSQPMVSSRARLAHAWNRISRDIPTHFLFPKIGLDERVKDEKTFCRGCMKRPARPWKENPLSTLLETAARTYQLIVPRDLLERPRVERNYHYPRRKLEVWLRDQVLPAIETLWPRARFQEQVTHPVRAFQPGADTPEWRCLEEVARTMRASASALLALAQAVAQQGNLPTVSAARQGLEESRAEPVKLGSAQAKAMDVAMALCQIEDLQRRDAAELVSADDYFGPLRDAGFVIDGRAVTNGAFLQLLNPQLGFVGNHIVRCMLTRIDQERDALERVRRAVFAATGRHEHQRLFDAERVAYADMKGAVATLERVSATSPPALLVESCIVLAQVYRDCAEPTPDIGWLKLSEQAQKHRRGHVRHALLSGADYVTGQRIAQALDDARKLYAGAPADQAVIEEAIETGELVLVECRREVYWEGKKVDQDWRKNRAPWVLLWQLAARGRRGQDVLAQHLYPEDPSKPRSTMASRWGRLKVLLPASLRRYVLPGSETSSYILKLDSHRIHIFADAKITPASEGP